jgi:hypothetical protein
MLLAALAVFSTPSFAQKEVDFAAAMGEARSAAPEIVPESAIKPGDRVVAFAGPYKAAGGFGNVIEIKGATAYVQFETFGRTSWPADSLAKAVPEGESYNGFFKGARVMEKLTDRTGEAKEVFTNGIVRVQYDGDTTLIPWDSTLLAYRMSCVDGVCMNARVNDSHFGDGSVVEVYSNHTPVIDYDSHYGWWTNRTTRQVRPIVTEPAALAKIRQDKAEYDGAMRLILHSRSVGEIGQGMAALIRIRDNRPDSCMHQEAVEYLRLNGL